MARHGGVKVGLGVGVEARPVRSDRGSQGSPLQRSRLCAPDGEIPSGAVQAHEWALLVPGTTDEAFLAALIGRWPP
jgi:hypothetical protein